MDLTTLRSLKEGDKVKISKIVTVKSNGGSYSVRAEDREFWDKNLIPGYVDADNPNVYDIELVERIHKNPDHWPPQAGDVWRQEDKTEVFVTGYVGSSPLRSALYFVTDNDSPSTKEKLLKNNPTLVYRKGNNL